MSEKSIDVLIALMHNVHYLTDDYYVYQSFRRMHWMCSSHVIVVRTAFDYEPDDPGVHSWLLNFRGG